MVTVKTCLKRASVYVFGFLIAMQVFANSSFAQEEGGAVSPLISALRATNDPVSIEVAESLISLKNSRSSYDLHLRNADLNHRQIESIAQAVRTVHENGGPSLRSFSMSYNSDLGDDGVLILIKNLPPSITEIGLVGSGLGDKGGDALLKWATRLKQLRWLCIEENAFSNELKARLRKFGQQKNGLLVVF